MAVDSIETRKLLVEKFTRNANTKLIVETRMGSDEIQTYNIKNREDYNNWLSTIAFDKATVEVSACGSPLSFGLVSTLASVIACETLVVWSNEKLYYDKVSMFLYPLDIEFSNY